jgi:hypothetical protein
MEGQDSIFAPRDTPKSFSEKSKILGVEPKDYCSGIILDNYDEIRHALTVHNNGIVDKSDETHVRMKKDIREVGGDYGVGIMELASMMAGNPDRFVDGMMDEIISRLDEKRCFYRNYEYTFNNFNKTSVTVKGVDDKYVLELCAAYVLGEPERNLAKILNKPMGLNCSATKAKLSIVDGWWFNADLSELLRNLPIEKNDLRGVANYYSDTFRERKPDIKVSFEGREFDLGISVDNEGYVRKPNGVSYIEGRGLSIVGDAWATYAEDGNTKIPPTPKEAYLVVSVSPSSKKTYDPAVKNDEIEMTHSVRDFLIKKLS